MKVAQYFGHNLQRVSLLRHPMVLGTNCVGVEVELENVTDWDMNSDYWVIKEDGSLRNNGREFVMRGPTGGKDLYNALSELDAYLADRNPDGNWRCSTHMHLDVRDMNVKQLKMMILAYLVTEKALFRLTAMHRYSNNFCAAIGFAQEQLQILVNAWHTDNIGDFWRRIEGWNKYSALNLMPMHNFGSVEFRMSDAKWTKNDLLLLCNRFLALKELAMHWEGTEEELVAYVINSPIHQVFPKGIPVDMPEDFLKEDIAVGHKLAFDLITFNQVARDVVREPVAIPVPQGGNGQWNHLSPEEHEGIINFMVRAGSDPDAIHAALFDGDDDAVAPAYKITSHVILRHMWGLYFNSRGLRTPNGDLPTMIPQGVMRFLVQTEWNNIRGLIQQDLMVHLMNPEQRERQENGDQQMEFNAPVGRAGGMLRGQLGAGVGRARQAVNRPQAQVAMNWEVPPMQFAEAGHAPRQMDIEAAEGDEFAVVDDGPF